jgi:stromal membrane-associated protein
MSRRPAGNDRASQNAQTLKALVKLEGNKVCADCKRNKHPRWASWNLGVFVCIRCSGIHRGMGTHISRVKSVDLDAWTDEQLQNILKWGNNRANKYWEAKLAPGHTPSEAKIENFIRTKYESKRWVMDGPMPDPSTLDADDDVPLNIVQEKAKLERSASQRLQQQSSPQRGAPPPPRAAPAPAVDLFGDLASDPPARPSTADIPQSKPATRTAPPQPKPAPRQGDSLLGLDFFGGPPSAGVGRPASAASNPTAPASNARGDLKNSILSLYASAPKPQPPSQPTHDRQPSFGGMTAPAAQQKDAFGGLADAFGGLNFSSSGPAKPTMQSPQSAFSGLTSFPASTSHKSAPSAAQVTSPPPLSGGSFFDATPTSPPAPKPAPVPQARNPLDFSFTQTATPASPPPPKAAPAPASKPAASIPADLFNNDDFGGWSSAPASVTAAPAPATAPKVTSPSLQKSNDFGSAFNLSSQPPKTSPTATRPAPVTQSSNTMFDPWGSSATDSSPWGAPDPAPAKPAAGGVDLGKVPSRITPNDITGGWGAPISQAAKPTRQPSVTADEDFGGWTSASTTQTPATTKPSGGFGGASDPFDNPWG